MNRLTDIFLGNTHSHIVYDPLGRMTDKQADGQTVATYDLQGKMTQKVLDLRELSSGVYTYTVCCGKNLQSGKIIIVK